ncbi:hypothetical protein PVA17_17315 [Lysinibacillus sp. CNPSo 3705]|uniref:hypothetical protein n=1 Tax=Lysinibacillus sp. CNPSo 3705 TaxID=3028148 RepID=UPI0023633ED7|nr:hypothetical protein [Lysinibacillus sp. CNPSo 3705]MDD1504505.1 hypothetical protein [Lysinibacillus sp. CNPSo 3705]
MRYDYGHDGYGGQHGGRHPYYPVTSPAHFYPTHHYYPMHYYPTHTTYPTHHRHPHHHHHHQHPNPRYY